MFRVLESTGRTIRSADTQEIVTIVNPSRGIKLIGSGHIDGVTTGHAQAAANSAAAASVSEQNAAASATTAETQAGLASVAHGLAVQAEGVAVSAAQSASEAMNSATSLQSQASSLLTTATGLSSTTLTALLEAAASQSASAASATTASGAAADARKLATEAENSLYTLTDSTRGYSALHYAVKAETAKNAAEALESTITGQLSVAQTANTTATEALSTAQDLLNIIAGSSVDFHQKYQGDSTTDLTTRADGTSLIAGDLYFNTTNQVMRFFTSGGTWINQVSATAPSVRKTFIFEVGSSLSHSFSGADITGKTLTFDEDNLEVYLNGTLVRPDEYTHTPSTNTVVLDSSVTLVEDDDVLITVITPFTVADVVTKSAGGTFAAPVGFDGNLDVNANIDLDGHIDIRNSGTPLILDRVFGTSLINQAHPIAAFSGNNALLGHLGVQSGNLYIEHEASGVKKTGLSFAGTEILPRSGGNPQSATVDLGSDATRFKTIYADDIEVRGRSAITDGITPLSPENNDLNYQTVGNRKNLRMPAITAGTNVEVTKTPSSITFDAKNARLLAAGFYRMATDTGVHVLQPNMYHVAPINEWIFQHPELAGRISNYPAASQGFAVPFDRKIFIEYGANMGFHDVLGDNAERDALGLLQKNGALRLRLTCPTALSSATYEVANANGYSNVGEFQQVNGFYTTPATIGFTEFRIEGRWPHEVSGCWSREVNAEYDASTQTWFGPRVAWVKIWDTDVKLND